MIGSFTTGFVGETSDEQHLAQELENLGHEVRRCPRDQWKGFCDGNFIQPDWVLPEYADINIVAKWPHFNDEKYVYILRNITDARVLYWTWDFMQWPTPSDWHLKMCQAADVHLTNELGDFSLMREKGVKPYYFPMDVVSEEFPYQHSKEKLYDVVFFGSCIDQGVRKEYIKEAAKKFGVTIFAWNPQDWQKEGLTANEAVYGNEFNKVVSQSKICLQFSTSDDIYGYWSNRVGKILAAGGFLLARFVPGMEMFLRDGADYFSSVEEMNEKIEYYLEHETEREAIRQKGKQLGELFTSKQRMKELEILIYRYLNGGM